MCTCLCLTLFFLQIVALRDIALFVSLDERERKHALQESVHEVAKMVCMYVVLYYTLHASALHHRMQALHMIALSV